MCVPLAFAEHALALFGDAKQAMGEEKSGLIETGLTRPVAMALSGGKSWVSTLTRDNIIPVSLNKESMLKMCE